MNIVKGDWVKFKRTIFAGGHRARGRYQGGKPTGEEVISGTVERESYGASTGQHTFSIRRDDTGKIKRVMGRNLYPNIIEHRPGPGHRREAEAKADRIDLARDLRHADTTGLPARER